MDSFVEMDFRDGRFAVPMHLAALMGDMETFRFTYRDAVAEVNKTMQGRTVGRLMEKHIQGHFGRGTSE